MAIELKICSVNSCAVARGAQPLVRFRIGRLGKLSDRCSRCRERQRQHTLRWRVALSNQRDQEQREKARDRYRKKHGQPCPNCGDYTTKVTRGGIPLRRVRYCPCGFREETPL